MAMIYIFFFFNDTATTEIYTLSLHDALPIYINQEVRRFQATTQHVISVDTKKKELVGDFKNAGRQWRPNGQPRSEEHTSELQSPCNLVCRLLLEKKKKIQTSHRMSPHIMSYH